MGKAVQKGLSLIEERKNIYKQNALDYYRPWMVLITDGKPTDAEWEKAADQAIQEQDRGGVVFYSIGVEGADMQTLARFSSQRQPLKLKGLAFQELFIWLSKSLAIVSQSRPGEMVPLPPIGWAELET